MSLYERYELLDLARDIGVKTFEAREIATGRPVQVHLFVHPSAPLQAALLKAIDKLPDDKLQRVVERGNHEGTPYVVTEQLAGYPGLSEWVQAAGHSAKPSKPLLETARAWKVPAAHSEASPIVPSAPAPAPASPSGSSPSVHTELDQKFTDLFATAERPIVADSLLQAPREGARNIAAPLRPPDPQPPVTVSSPPPTPEPGEFTRMFQSPVVTQSPGVTQLMATPPTAAPAPRAVQQAPPAQVLMPAAKTPPPAAKEPGEFTRMFQAPGGHGAGPAPPAAPPTAIAPDTTKSNPGEFTRFFETPSPAGPLPHSPAVQQPLTPQGSGRGGFNPVSEFTRTFGKPGSDAPVPPPAAAPQQEPGEFTRMFHSPAVSGPKAGAAGPPAAQTPPSAPQAATQSQPSATGGASRGFSIETPPAAPQPSGPGEYTRQFSAPAQLTFGQTSATPPAPAAPPSAQAFAPPAMAQPAMPNMAVPTAARKSNLPLILGIVGIVVVAVLLIVFFAIRPR